MKIKILLALCAILTRSVTAQDAHYSQFYLNPLAQNPALAGVMNGAHRLNLTYRDQSRSLLHEAAFTTTRLDYDAQVPTGKRDFIGLGATIFTDKSGSLDLRQTAVHATLSYSRQLSGGRSYEPAHYLNIGFQVGFVQQNLNFNQTTWGSQNERGVYNPSLPAQESFDLTDFSNRSYGDASVGLLWWYKNGEKSEFYAGLGYFHVNQPRTHLGNFDLGQRLAIQSGGSFQIAHHWDIAPQLMAQYQSKLFEMNIGTALRFHHDKKTYSQVGLWNRLGNGAHPFLNWQSLIVTAKLKLDTWGIGVAYDVNTTRLGAARRSKGMELNLVYVVPASKPRKQFGYCPTF
jgi:type IX secretion system PorP/SprF family membrane protein